MQYSPMVERHFRAPVGAGAPRYDTGRWVRGEAGERALGTHIVFHLRAEAGRVAELRFQAFGCPHTIAACSLAAERLSGQPVEALREFSPRCIAAALDLPVEKLGRLLMVEDALRNCFVAWDNSQLDLQNQRVEPWRSA